MSGSIGRRLRPWAGLVVGVAGLAVAHQFGADGEFDDCQRFAPMPLLVVAAACIVIIMIAAWSSGGVVRRGGPPSAAKVVAVISTGFALLACFAIILPMAAAIILPPCFQ